MRRTLAPVIRSHYQDLDQIANDVASLGNEAASRILQARIPDRYSSQAADLGEILGAEFFDAHTKFSIPIKKLRYKDHRNTPLRGDDIIGVSESDDGTIQLLKAEAKSRAQLHSNDIKKARQALVENDGQPAAHTLVFITDRLLESSGDDRRLGQRLRNEFALAKLENTKITHGLSILCGDDPRKLLIKDLSQVDSEYDQIVIGMQVTDLREFIANMYEEVSDLGNR